MDIYNDVSVNSSKQMYESVNRLNFVSKLTSLTIKSFSNLKPLYWKNRFLWRDKFVRETDDFLSDTEKYTARCYSYAQFKFLDVSVVRRLMRSEEKGRSVGLIM